MGFYRICWIAPHTAVQPQHQQTLNTLFDIGAAFAVLFLQQLISVELSNC